MYRSRSGCLVTSSVPYPVSRRRLRWAEGLYLYVQYLRSIAPGADEPAEISASRQVARNKTRCRRNKGILDAVLNLVHYTLGACQSSCFPKMENIPFVAFLNIPLSYATACVGGNPLHDCLDRMDISRWGIPGHVRCPSGMYAWDLID